MVPAKLHQLFLWERARPRMLPTASTNPGMAGYPPRPDRLCSGTDTDERQGWRGARPGGAGSQPCRNTNPPAARSVKAIPAARHAKPQTRPQKPPFPDQVKLKSLPACGIIPG